VAKIFGSALLQPARNVYVSSERFFFIMHVTQWLVCGGAGSRRQQYEAPNSPLTRGEQPHRQIRRIIGHFGDDNSPHVCLFMRSSHTYFMAPF